MSDHDQTVAGLGRDAQHVEDGADGSEDHTEHEVVLLIREVS